MTMTWWMTWWCRWFGHWVKRGPVIDAFTGVHGADYKLCRICGRYWESPVCNAVQQKK